MQHIVDAIKTYVDSAKTCGIQLAHDDKESSSQDHGWFKIKDADGVVIHESTDYQHNRNYSNQRSEALKIAEIVNSYIASAAKKRGKSDDTAETVDSQTSDTIFPPELLTPESRDEQLMLLVERNQNKTDVEQLAEELLFMELVTAGNGATGDNEKMRLTELSGMEEADLRKLRDEQREVFTK